VSSPQDRFTVTVHAEERILEVHYPPRPSLEAYDAYEAEVRAAISSFEGEFDCLVDQSALKALAPEFPPRLAALNLWARENGMRRTLRVVGQSAVGELQSQRILRESGNTDVGQLFHDRAEAWRALRGGGPAPS
jgi:hypothetical protein